MYIKIDKGRCHRGVVLDPQTWRVSLSSVRMAILAKIWRVNANPNIEMTDLYFEKAFYTRISKKIHVNLITSHILPKHPRLFQQWKTMTRILHSAVVQSQYIKLCDSSDPTRKRCVILWFILHTPKSSTCLQTQSISNKEGLERNILLSSNPSQNIMATLQFHIT